MTKRIAILGAGVMGEAILSSILDAGHPASELVTSVRRPVRAEALRNRYGIDVVSNVAAAADADIIMIAVKPNHVEGLLKEIACSVRASATVVSLAAGITTGMVRDTLTSGVAVLRVMPNTPVLIGEGMFGVSTADGVDPFRVAEVIELLGGFGQVVVVDEIHQDAVTAVSGSGPAYLFYLAEAMIDGGVDAGLDLETARTLAEQTLVGAAKLLVQSSEPAEVLRRQVTSPNGTTDAAVETFDNRGVKDGLIAGIRASAARSAELSAGS